MPVRIGHSLLVMKEVPAEEMAPLRQSEQMFSVRDTLKWLLNRLIKFTQSSRRERQGPQYLLQKWCHHRCEVVRLLQLGEGGPMTCRA